jgi:hypothetical protein
MDISCHYFMRMAKLAEPLMSDGGVLVTMSYYGAEKVVPNYSLMGPVKAALEAAVRYLAYELGPKGIRVHAVSPGPLKTRAASGLAHFDELLAEAELRAPERDLVDILDVGAATAFLCSPFAKLITGGTIYADGQRSRIKLEANCLDRVYLIPAGAGDKRLILCGSHPGASSFYRFAFLRTSENARAIRSLRQRTCSAWPATSCWAWVGAAGVR